MPNPAEINRLGGAEPTEGKPERARLGLDHSQPPSAALDSVARRGVIRLITFFVHVSTAVGFACGVCSGRFARAGAARPRLVLHGLPEV